jgi:plastocyanin
MLRFLSRAGAVALLALVSQASTIDVTQTGFGFSPQNVTIQVGDTVRWNWTSFAHTITQGTDGTIDGNELFNGAINSVTPQFSFTFTAAFVNANPMPNGVYDYFCEPHFMAGMIGSVRVNTDTGTAFCFGDGTGTACPCANSGALGHGCANSISPAGALLAATGTAQVSADTVVLTGSDMPNAACLYFQGTAQANTVFGDGLRCAGGSVTRLGTKVNVAGGSQYPAAGDASVSVRGAVPAAGGTRTYQTWYRNAAAFCTPAAFNLSNGVEIAWAP